MPRTKYLLTINNQPATFIGGQICYARNRYRGGGIRESELAESPRHARQLIAKSIKQRRGKGLIADDTEEAEEYQKYGFMPIRLGV